MYKSRIEGHWLWCYSKETNRTKHTKCVGAKRDIVSLKGYWWIWGRGQWRLTRFGRSPSSVVTRTPRVCWTLEYMWYRGRGRALSSQLVLVPTAYGDLRKSERIGGVQVLETQAIPHSFPPASLQQVCVGNATIFYELEIDRKKCPHFKVANYYMHHRWIGE